MLNHWNVFYNIFNFSTNYICIINIYLYLNQTNEFTISFLLILHYFLYKFTQQKFFTSTSRENQSERM